MSRKKKDSTSPNIIKLKIFFLLTLIAAGFIMTQMVKKPEIILAENSTLQKIPFKIPSLGDVKGVMDSLTTESFKKKTNELKKQILGQSDVLLQQKASEAGSIATDFVFDKAINPILDQIHKLPQDEQERLRKQICK